jgi:hypothetical protein
LAALESQRTGLSVFHGECHHRWATCQIDVDPIHWAVRHVDVAFGDAHLGTQAISRDLQFEAARCLVVVASGVCAKWMRKRLPACTAFREISRLLFSETVRRCPGCRDGGVESSLELRLDQKNVIVRSSYPTERVDLSEPFGNLVPTGELSAH